ncbi:hypothetical protein [Algibacter sp.]|uniref:hypothetical protein n=1 Tax=Algibacter sp. TaxID=1872428 RepID=UPI003C77F5F2
MRKKMLCLVVFAMALCAGPNTVFATEKPASHTTVKGDEIPEEIKALIDRLNIIKEMDKSTLSRVEKKELRKEVRAIKKTVKASGNGIYISSGAIIIILLLIIIF